VRALAGTAAGLLLAATAAACGPETSGTPVAELWSEHCASCHGADGSGHPARRRLEPRLDLTRSPMVVDGARGLIFQRIAYGYSTMPGFAHKLPQGDIEMLVEFVQRFAAR
jgi:mono/diheme cytochrome c family protein